MHVWQVSFYLPACFHTHRFLGRASTNEITIDVSVPEAPSDVCSELMGYRVPEKITPDFLPALAANFQNN